uniref:Uncharacterized protein n=1 Tax=Eutreptiella gymnastica TaxID=73025 RepID=A0A7S4GGY1_9EUGL
MGGSIDPPPPAAIENPSSPGSEGDQTRNGAGHRWGCGWTHAAAGRPVKKPRKRRRTPVPLDLQRYTTTAPLSQSPPETQTAARLHAASANTRTDTHAVAVAERVLGFRRNGTAPAVDRPS